MESELSKFSSIKKSNDHTLKFYITWYNCFKFTLSKVSVSPKLHFVFSRFLPIFKLLSCQGSGDICLGSNVLDAGASHNYVQYIQKHQLLLTKVYRYTIKILLLFLNQLRHSVLNARKARVCFNSSFDTSNLLVIFLFTHYKGIGHHPVFDLYITM